MDIPYTCPGSSTVNNTNGESGIAPRLERDVRIEPDQSRVPLDVEAEGSDLPDDLGQDPSGATARGRIRVIQPEPQTILFERSQHFLVARRVGRNGDVDRRRRFCRIGQQGAVERGIQLVIGRPVDLPDRDLARVHDV